MSVLGRLHPLAALLALALRPGPATAAPPPPASPPSLQGPEVVATALSRLAVQIRQTRLDNGLRVVLLPDPESPTVSVAVTYDVGSRDEEKGQSGFAHLFEHMMFQGSRNVDKGAHFQLVTGRGGQLNGTTSADRTNYFETLPKNELSLALWLEADRMRWLNISAENFENQRSVVREEYHMRVDNAAYRPGLIKLDELVFASYPPYAHPTIGSLADLDAAPLSWVADFHARYYRPNNAVLSIAGGFDPDEAMGKIHQFFDPIQSPSLPAKSPVKPPPPTKSAESVEVNDPNAKTAAVALGWRIPPSRTPDHYALEATARILGDGESSVLYDLLVRQRAVARDVSVWTADHRDIDSFTIFVELTEQADPRQIVSLVETEVMRLIATGGDKARLERAHTRAQSDLVRALQSSQSRAVLLGEYAVLFGDPGLFAEDLSRLRATTTADIKRATATYLGRETCQIVTILPSTKTGFSKAPKP